MPAMPFGRHRGTPISDLPTGYLRWLLTIDLERWLENAVRAVLRDRLGAEPPRRRTRAAQESPAGTLARVLPIVQQWYREMALKFHPDRGGSAEAMNAINAAHERLRELLSVA